MKNSLAAFALLAAVSVLAADKTSPPPPKARTIKSLIDLAMTSENPQDLATNMIGEFDVPAEALSDGKLPTKAVYFKQSDSPDRHRHEFSVAYKIGSQGAKDSPVFLIWDVVYGHKRAGVIYVDGYAMRVSLGGKLERIVSIRGVVSQGTHTNLDVQSPEAQAAFKHEWNFYTRESAKLKLNIE